MTIAEAALLGAVQGVTEFLPISSSGHLVLFEQLFNIQQSALTFTVVIHLATLLAILLFFGKSLLHLTRRELVLIGVGTIPAIFVGVLFRQQIEGLFNGDAFVGVELIITGLINFYTDRKLGPKTEQIETDIHAQKDLTEKKSFLIGVAQAIAIIPGISRSGSTVAAGVGLGLDREQAFRFSFLLAIPALLGAGVLELVDVWRNGTVHEINVPVYAIGALMALITGLLSLFVFKYVMSKAKLEIFGWYCVIVGTIAVVLNFI